MFVQIGHDDFVCLEGVYATELRRTARAAEGKNNTYVIKIKYDHGGEHQITSDDLKEIRQMYRTLNEELEFYREEKANQR